MTLPKLGDRVSMANHPSVREKYGLIPTGVVQKIIPNDRVKIKFDNMDSCSCVYTEYFDEKHKGSASFMEVVQ